MPSQLAAVPADRQKESADSGQTGMATGDSRLPGFLQRRPLGQKGEYFRPVALRPWLSPILPFLLLLPFIYYIRTSLSCSENANVKSDRTAWRDTWSARVYWSGMPSTDIWRWKRWMKTRAKSCGDELGSETETGIQH